jgi:hypothetical protein
MPMNENNYRIFTRRHNAKSFGKSKIIIEICFLVPTMRTVKKTLSEDVCKAILEQ